ncbi:hypothetical protein [Microbulbifer sp. 2201CG32-9]|uniref:hypothetical protein n=1 Tax=unclassified Microbulbifer TaxID=2619833 RepID=UPI00345BDBA4
MRQGYGEAQRRVAAVVGPEWTTMHYLVEKTGLTRNTIRRCLMVGGYEVRHGGPGHRKTLEARKPYRVPSLNLLNKRWV